MSTVTTSRDRWYIPAAVEAAAVRRPPGYADDDLARIDALDDDRMRDCLIFLSGYAPGVLDALLTATEPCKDDEYPPDDDAIEPFCKKCGAAVGVFTSIDGEWRHYRGDPVRGGVDPFDPGHLPLVRWRRASGHQDPPVVF